MKKFIAICLVIFSLVGLGSIGFGCGENPVNSNIKNSNKIVQSPTFVILQQYYSNNNKEYVEIPITQSYGVFTTMDSLITINNKTFHNIGFMLYMYNAIIIEINGNLYEGETVEPINLVCTTKYRVDLIK